MNQDVFNNPVFQNIAPEKKAILLDFIKEANGLSPEKALPLLAKTNSKMKALGLTFTKEESDLITNTLLSNLSPADRRKFEAIRKMLMK